MVHLEEYNEHDDETPTCPMRGNVAVRMTPEEVAEERKTGEPTLFPPDESIGQYYVRCTSCRLVFIHTPRQPQ